MIKIKRRIKKLFIFIREILCYLFLRPAGMIMYRKRNVWLIAERGTDARDNAFHLFGYITKNHPETEIYYVISENSPDRARVSALGKTVNTGSFRHYLLFFGAKALVSTHFGGCAPYLDFYIFLIQRLHIKPVKAKVAFLQHGVILNAMPTLYNGHTDFDLFICGAKPEYDFILGTYGYTDKTVKYTGLARFDKLADFKVKRQILIMPTWRDWLVYSSRGMSDEEIRQSEYMRRWQSIVASERLGGLAEKYDVDVYFYPHYEIQKYVGMFESKSDRVHIADFAHYDVQTLLKESMLLITDYSSVFFDFAYMKKPVIYYQFDEKEFFEKHYSRGYFDNRAMGFGPVVTEEDKLFEEAEKYAEQGFKMPDEYLKRTEGFFPLSDSNNCERIYNAICGMMK